MTNRLPYLKLIPDPLICYQGRLKAGHLSFFCALGKNGLAVSKQEGDLKTPKGVYRFLYGFYRADRIMKPRSQLHFLSIAPYDGWCDDPSHTHYNHYIKKPFKASHEDLWRRDNIYDIILVLDHNSFPVIKGRGSAVFMHLARDDFSGTEGCIALSKNDLLWLTEHIDDETKLLI